MPGEQVGSDYVSISLDDSKLESGLNAAKGKVSSAVGGMGSAIGSALKTGAVAGAAALAGIATVGTKTFMDVESAAADAASKMDLSAIAKQSGKTTEEAFKSVKEHVMSLADELGQHVRRWGLAHALSESEEPLEILIGEKGYLRQFSKYSSQLLKPWCLRAISSIKIKLQNPNSGWMN